LLQVGTDKCCMHNVRVLVTGYTTVSNLSRDNVNEGVQGQKQAASRLPASYYSFESDYMSLHFKCIQWFLAQLSMDTPQDNTHLHDHFTN